MTTRQGETPLAWRYCGNQVKLWRTNCGTSREELARAAGYSPDTVKSMEQGARMPTPQLLDVADDLFRAQGLLRAAKQYLRRERFPARSHDFFGYEADAISLWCYETTLVPGLLQTESYARALISEHSPPLDEEVIEERIAARVERQTLLDRKPPAAFSFVMYEAALRARIGGPEVYRDQLAHLLKIGRHPRVTLQVLPFTQAIPLALTGPLVLLETRDHENLALVEGQSLSHLTSAPADISALTLRYGMIRTEALSTEESARFITRMLEEL
ncbi:helix-turn-helix transcriptional regulator [Streptomyces sp. 549]|uniref:helix-turn-helix domain-containing protein n=1 Tax=Streptomyces sp. 549 TaxID=3049076 RepID=UPI0024C44FE6|nr:helix-turn-helix transcriptional regulator [Streptomyces sp. 549]MDK1472481.1 helix-turn-helix transcriptional regulator [Streptomyces sp. 549]